MGFLTSFVKNGEIIPSISYKIIIEQREERSQLETNFLFLLSAKDFGGFEMTSIFCDTSPLTPT